MTQLLRLHFRFSSKALLLLLAVIILLVVIYSKEVIQLNFVTLAFLLITYLPTICLAHLLDGKFSTLLRTFPLSPKDIVQSTYVYMMLLLAIFLVPISGLVLYQFVQGKISAVTICYLLWIFAYTMATTGAILKAYFREPTNSKSFSGADLFFCILLTALPHLLLCLLFSGFLYIGALITPIVCLFIFYKQYEASIRLYEQAEFL